MNKDRLVVVNEDYRYYLQWHLAEEDDMGLSVGEVTGYDTEEDAPSDREEWENWIAHKVAQKSKGLMREGQCGYFYWDSKSQASLVLREIKLAWRVERDLPEWAKAALAAGWKPPKGWKP